MSDYDDTNRGVAFPPRENQKLFLTGKLNINGQDQRTALVKNITPNGTKLIEVYQKIGVLFVNKKQDNPDAPAFAGPIDDTNLRIAAWKKEKDGMNYLSMSVSENQQQKDPSPQQDFKVDDPFDDDIPFQ